MSKLVYFGLWLAVCVWASFVVARRIENRRDRIAYYLLIWLIPVIGAAAAVLLSRKRESGMTASEKMFEEVVDAHKRKS